MVATDGGGPHEELHGGHVFALRVPEADASRTLCRITFCSLGFAAVLLLHACGGLLASLNDGGHPADAAPQFAVLALLPAAGLYGAYRESTKAAWCAHVGAVLLLVLQAAPLALVALGLLQGEVVEAACVVSATACTGPGALGALIRWLCTSLPLLALAACMAHYSLELYSQLSLAGLDALVERGLELGAVPEATVRQRLQTSPASLASARDTAFRMARTLVQGEAACRTWDGESEEEGDLEGEWDRDPEDFPSGAGAQRQRTASGETPRSAPRQTTIVVLEKAALELAGGLVSAKAVLAEEESELLITYDSLIALLDSPLNKAGGLQVYIHSAEGALVEVSPSLFMPGTLRGFAQVVADVLKNGQVVGSAAGAPGMKIIEGPVQRHFPECFESYRLAPSGQKATLRELWEELAASARGAAGDEPAPPCSLVFALTAAHPFAGDATLEEDFGAAYIGKQVAIHPFKLAAASYCRMLCAEPWDRQGSSRSLGSEYSDGRLR